jgi:magnesium and cobalt transporter
MIKKISFKPSWILGWIIKLINNRNDLIALLQTANRNNLINDESLSIVERAIQVEEMQVREIMIPKSQMVCIKEDQTSTEALTNIIESAHSRFPILSANQDEVVGIFLAKDLLPIMLEKQDFNIRDHMRHVTFIPESKRLNVLLKELRTTRNHMAVVVDEFGGIAGLVTIEDVLEQIVGDIEDETDVDEGVLIKLDPENSNSYIVKAIMPIDEFNEELDANCHSDEFDTIGGIVIQLLGRMPLANESIDYAGFTFEVISAEKRRIKLLRVTKK